MQVAPFPWPLIAAALLLLLLNLAGFALALHDKRRARKGGLRTPELAFHVLALLCAWPGCLLGFLVARHKTRKRRFQVPFVLAGALGTSALALLVLAATRPWP